MNARCWWFASLLLALPNLAQAWWNEEWNFRKSLTLDTSASGANLQESLNNFPVLVRLHGGNFAYFLDIQEDGRDLRFIAGDDKTPLKFHLEQFDPINGIALIWVQVPRISGQSNSETIWMYYGNPDAVAGEDATATYDVNHTLVYHFADANAVSDSTAYQHSAQESGAATGVASLIGPGAAFNGQQLIKVPVAPPLRLVPSAGWSASAWIKIDQPQQNATLWQLADTAHAFTVDIDGSRIQARFDNASTAGAELALGQWQHVAVTAKDRQVTLYLNGAIAGQTETDVAELGGTLSIGASTAGERFFIGQLDELRVSNTARAPAWIAASARSEGIDSTLLDYGPDDQYGGSSESNSYFNIILQNVTVDGWVVIVILAVMAAISWVVMFAKGFILNRAHRDNQRFLAQFHQLGTQDAAKLDHAETDEERELDGSPLLIALLGSHKHFQSSPIYRIYHQGIQELQRRTAPSVGAQAAGLTTKALNSIHARLDAVQVRENQKLNAQMVLLTIAISGGPFLGLLGTVVGVMITFAAIAATGDVNINAIAPGIAAALVATVAGLAVAIPALFGYNYLISRVKNITSDMQVFVDEFMTRTAEHYGE